MERILITGALGQLGNAFVNNFNKTNCYLLATDIRHPKIKMNCEFEILDVLNKERIDLLVEKYKINIIYHLAAVLSASGEISPFNSWKLNMDSFQNIAEISIKHNIRKIFWPSSIAVFGPSTPKIKTSQKTIMEPSTVYGISKLSGEFWCNYYHEQYGVDVRSLRYPGIISWKTKPGGGTTDYAVDIFFKALKEGKYECFLAKDTRLPMMYMEDAVQATIALMQADRNRIKIRSSYNLAAIDFTPKEISEEIKKHLPDFEMSYHPDFRQKIADSWPQSIDDAEARKDWGWQHEFNLETMTRDMIHQLQKK